MSTQPKQRPGHARASQSASRVNLAGEWRTFTQFLPKDCGTIGTVTINRDDTGAMLKVTGGEVCMLNRSRVVMKMNQLERK